MKLLNNRPSTSGAVGRAIATLALAIACVAGAGPSVQDPEHAEEGEPAADEKITVTAQRMALTAAERQQLYEELAKARDLYRRNQIKDALPYLERTARNGFKDSQAKMGHILLQGLGDVRRDSLSAVGWLGVASSGRTSPTIRNYFNDIWRRIPERHVPVFEEVVQEYTNKYGAEATGVVCDMTRRAGTHLKTLNCFFEAGLDEDARQGSEVRRAHEQQEELMEGMVDRMVLDCFGAGGAINSQCQ